MTHLTEEERQCLADGTVAGDRAAVLAPHLASCEACAADVGRLRAAVQRLREQPVPDAPLDSLWPAIRSRIEHGKAAELGAQHGPRRGRARTRRAASIGTALAAAVAGIIVLARSRPHEPPRGAPPAGHSMPHGEGTLEPATDSGGTSQADMQRLLDEIQLEKAMLPPSTAAVADSDLRAIDTAIAELRAALARDPNNPALRQMLAESYRQQRDLLKRLHNAS